MKSTQLKSTLTEGDIKKHLLKLCIPMTIGILSLLFFNLADVYFVEKLGESSIIALGFCIPLMLLLLNFNIGMSTGVTAVCSKLIAQQKSETLSKTSFLLFAFNLLFCGLLVLALLFSLQPIFNFMGVSSDIYPLLTAYLKPWLYGFVILNFLMLCNAFFRATGNTKTPSKIMLAAGIINAVLNPILIFGYFGIQARGIEGAAIATVISWFLGSFWALILLKKESGFTKICIPSFKEVLPLLSEPLKIGLTASLTNMLLPFSAKIMTCIIASHGLVYVGAYGIASRIEPIAMVLVISLSASIVPFIAQNLGANKWDRVKEGVETTLSMAIKFELIIAVSMILLCSVIARFFSSSAIMQETLTLYFFIIPISFAFQAISVIISAVFNAFSKPFWASSILIIRVFVLQLPLAYFGGQFYGIVGIFIGRSLAALLGALIAHYFYKKLIVKQTNPIANMI